MVSARLYVEGGGNSKELKDSVSPEAFVVSWTGLGVIGRMPRIVACGSRDNAYDRFKTGHESKGVDATLLVDAEGPVSAIGSWEYLQQSDGWSRPRGATDDQCHLMVQVMESWFLADPDALQAYFGQGFRRQIASGESEMSSRFRSRTLKVGLMGRLGERGRGASKGYDKGADSFEILMSLGRPGGRWGRKGSCYAERFVQALL